MPLKPDHVVTINFTLKDEDENIIESTDKGHPFAFLSGRKQILPRLEEKIGEMIIGGKGNLVLAPKDAYGELVPEAIQIVPRSNFPPETNVEVGMEFMADTPDGRQMPFIITSVDGENITLDFNHPLAGKTLEFDIELVDIRQATTEELSHGHAHGGADGNHH